MLLDYYYHPVDLLLLWRLITSCIPCKEENITSDRYIKYTGHYFCLFFFLVASSPPIRPVSLAVKADQPPSNTRSSSPSSCAISSFIYSSVLAILAFNSTMSHPESIVIHSIVSNGVGVYTIIIQGSWGIVSIKNGVLPPGLCQADSLLSPTVFQYGPVRAVF